MDGSTKHAIRIIIAVLSAGVILALSGCDSQQAVDEPMDMDAVETGVEITHGDLRIKDIWGRPSFEGDNAVVYLSVHNEGQEADLLRGIQSDIGAMAQVHEMKMENDVMQMQAVSGDIEIAAGASIEFAPGGYHIMVMGLTKDLAVGNSHNITLVFENAGEVTVEVEVIQP